MAVRVSARHEFKRAAVAHGNAHGIFAVVIVRKKAEGKADLFEIGQTLDLEGFRFRAGQSREVKRRQQSDDGNDYQQFH